MHLVIGGARSGKSRYAQSLAESIAKGSREVIYIATATRLDESMSRRIDHHIKDRPEHWQTIEEPIELTSQLSQLNTFDGVVIVDCLTLWLNNQLHHYPEQNVTYLLEQLAAAAGHVPHLILVSNEVGLGVIPMGELSQRFVDESGRMNQLLAAKAEKVTFMVAGLPMCLKV